MGELRLMLLGGIFLGLGYVFIPLGLPAPEGASAFDDGAVEMAGETGGGGTRVKDAWAAVIVDGDTSIIAGN